MKTVAIPDWPGRIHRIFADSRISQIAYVPDTGHARLIELCRADRQMRSVLLTTEEEGIALLAGAWLGGERGALLMQSSGAGNCINMLGMVQAYRFPLLMLVTMRGQWGEFNPAQVPMGQATPAALASIGVIVHEVDDAGCVEETVAAAAGLVFGAGRAVAVLISQRVVGAKNWSE